MRDRERENKGGRGGGRERDRTHANTDNRPKNRGTQLYTCTHTIGVSASKEHHQTQDKPLSYACSRRAFRGAHSRQASAEGLQKLTGSHVGIAGGLVGAGGELQGLSSLDVCIARGRVLVRIILRGERWGRPRGATQATQATQTTQAHVQRSHHAQRTMETRQPHPAPVATAETTANGEHGLVEHQPRPPPPPRLSPQQTCSLRAVQRARAPLTGAPYFQARSASGRQPAVPCTMLARAGTVPPSLLPPARRSPAARGTARAARGSPSGAR